MLITVLQRLAADTGLDAVQQRNTLVALLYNAAKEMYDRLECNKVYWEITLAVPPNKIITVPSYIGEIRGLRKATTLELFDLHSMHYPRYSRQDWSYRWDNWRDLGESAVMQNPSAVGPLSISTSNGEPTNIEVLISGQTDKAIKDEERVVMTTPAKTTTKMFGPSIYTIGSVVGTRTADISISDSNGNLIAILYTADQETRYKMFDVAEYPWSQDDASGNCLVDVQFKVPLRHMVNDSDRFPASSDFDNAWYWMAMYLYYNPLQNKPEGFSQFYPNCLTAMLNAKRSGERNVMKKVNFGPNKFHDLAYKTPPKDWIEYPNATDRYVT